MPNLILFGYRAWARIGIKVEPGHLENVASKLVNNPSIYYVVYTLGRFDIIISSFFKTTEQLSHFVNFELTRIQGIQSTETMLLVSPRKYNLFSWPKTISEGNQNELKHNENNIDKTEQGILENLMENGLMRPRDLASRLNIGESKIRRSLKNMLKNELYKLEVVPLTDIKEYETQATIGINISIKSPHRVMDSILKHPAVYLASTALGRFNIVVAARFPNNNLLNQFITKFLSSITGISTTETYVHIRRLKYHNVTWPQFSTTD